MNDKEKGKASQDSPDERDIPQENLIIELEEESDDQRALNELASRANYSGNKRKQSPRAVDDDDPPIFDYRSIPIHKKLNTNINQIDLQNPPIQCYPYLIQEKFLKDWEEIILSADSHTKAANQEIVQRAELLCNFEKKLEDAKESIELLINFEKENYEIIENMSNDLESVTRKIVKLKDYSRQVVQRQRNSLLYYAKKVEQKAASEDEVEQPKPAQEHSEKSDAVSRP